MSEDGYLPDGEEFLFQKRQENPGPRLAVVVEPNVGWSVQGELISHDARLTDTPPKIIQLQVQFDNQMQTHTVQFNGPDNLPQNITGGVVCEAEILWSVEGTTVRRLISVTDGMAISGEAQSVTVNIYDKSHGAGDRYLVGCTVAPGVRGDTQQPPLLRVDTITGAGTAFPWGVGLLAGNSCSWELPANVGAISSFLTVLGTPPPAAPLVDNSVEISHFNGGGVPVQFYGLNGCFKYIPIYGSTKRIRITNNSPGTIAVAHHFGIEG